MSKPDIFTVQKRIRCLSPEHKLAFLSSLIKAEGPRTSRRAQLEVLAKKIRTEATRAYVGHMRRQERLAKRLAKQGEA
jgi:hypothetical protein